VRRIDINDPAVDMDAGQRLLYNGEPFTGDVIEGFMEDPFSLETYRDGWLHGPWRLWCLDGSPKAQGEFVNGGLVGESLTWHENGRLESRRLFSERSSVLADYAWDEEGRQTRAAGPCPARPPGGLTGRPGPAADAMDLRSERVLTPVGVHRAGRVGGRCVALLALAGG